jgi:hypothetical protein
VEMRAWEPCDYVLFTTFYPRKSGEKKHLTEIGTRIGDCLFSFVSKVEVENLTSSTSWVRFISRGIEDHIEDKVGTKISSSKRKLYIHGPLGLEFPWTLKSAFCI